MENKREASKTMKSLPVSERPYEKAEEYGPKSLSDAELLAVILRTGARDVPARELAEKILKLGNPPGLCGLLHNTLQDYMEIRGVGKVKAVQLACVGELSRRIWKSAAVGEELVFDHPAKIADYYMEEMRHLEQENLKLLILNTKNVLIRDVDISRGTVNASLATPRELFIEALRYRGVGIILIHNHPSGDASPSREDCLFTKRVQEAGNLMGIPLLDHIIIGDTTYVSLRERGILST
jgi:DNA repair protein RadC